MKKTKVGTKNAFTKNLLNDLGISGGNKPIKAASPSSKKFPKFKSK